MISKRRNDIFLIAAILFISGVFFLIYLGMNKGGGDTLTIKVNDEIYGSYSLNRDQTIRINDTNTCVIKDGKVSMTDADCPDRICVHHKPIDKNGETIVCLPNRVILTVSGTNKENEVDSIAA